MKKKRITSPHVKEPPEGTWSNCLVIGDHIHIAGLTAGGMSDDMGSIGEYEQAKETFTRILFGVMVMLLLKSLLIGIKIMDMIF